MIPTRVVVGQTAALTIRQEITQKTPHRPTPIVDRTTGITQHRARTAGERTITITVPAAAAVRTEATQARLRLPRPAVVPAASITPVPARTAGVVTHPLMEIRAAAAGAVTVSRVISGSRSRSPTTSSSHSQVKAGGVTVSRRSQVIVLPHPAHPRRVVVSQVAAARIPAVEARAVRVKG